MTERPPLKEARAEVVRVRVIDAVNSLLQAGQPLTFKDIAREADVPERTVYRHFPTRTDLLAAVFEWANSQIAQVGPRPTTAAGATEWVRHAFRGFDGLAPVIRQMLIEPDGRSLRLADAAERRRAAIDLVDNEVPGLDDVARSRVAAAIQVLTVAATWQSLHEYWDLDGPDAGETSALAIELLLEGARTRTRHSPTA
jgi:AcrR family transcriptional regulator